MSKTLLAIDVGTQSVKTVLFDTLGNPLAKAQIPLPSYKSIHPGWFELDPNDFWKTICQTCQKLKNQINTEQLQGVALTTQRATVVNVDDQGRPLRDAIIWLDNRETDGLKPVGGVWGLIFKLAGLSKAIARVQSQAEVNWIQSHQPEIWDRTYKFLLLSGYLNYRLSGKFIDSIGNQVGYIPFDYKRHDWASKGDWKWKACPLSKSQLPDLVKCGSILGYMTPEAALQTGLPEGLPIIAAAADKACEVLGAGCINSNQASLSFGSAATVNIPSHKYIELYHYLPPYPAAYPGGYNMEYQIFEGFALVSWFIREFGIGDQPYKKLEEALQNFEPGSRGLILQPFWTPGLKISESSAKGAIIGFREHHNKFHIFQAIIEGLIFSLRQGMETIQGYTKTSVTDLRVSGGGSQSNAALQMTADIFGMPAKRPHLYEASCLGAAINVAVASGIYKSYENAIQSMTRISEIFYPRFEANSRYQSLYSGVFKKMLKQLTPLYEEIDKSLPM